MAATLRATILSRLPIHNRSPHQWRLSSRTFAAKRSSSTTKPAKIQPAVAFPPKPEDDDDDEDFIPSSTICRPLSEILKDMNKNIPDSLVKSRVENNFTMRYVPWYVLNRILNLHAPEWSGEVRSIVYSVDGRSATVVYRVTLYGTDAHIYREASGTASVDDTSYGGPVQKAEAMAFRRACARLGLGLHLYHEELS